MTTKRRPSTIPALACHIGTVLAVSVYTDGRAGSERWRCWLDDKTLRYVPSGCTDRREVPSGWGRTLDRAMEDLARQLRGSVISRDGRELSDEGQEWRVSKRLRALEA